MQLYYNKSVRAALQQALTLSGGDSEWPIKRAEAEVLGIRTPTPGTSYSLGWTLRTQLREEKKGHISK